MPTANQPIGPYKLLKKLGQGGFGEVWLAEKRTKFVTKKFAIKLPLKDQVDVDAVRHEATLWEQASGHPNVLPIIDADEYDEQIVIVSEYAPDGSLSDLLKKQGTLSVEKAIEMIDGILAGLEFLHSQKVIHRDLKPENILLQGEIPRLADFGISRVLRTTVTSSSVNLAGTPYYMAPEAFDKKRNVQTDIWSVGVILYEILTGKRPFDEDNLIHLVSSIATKEPEPLPQNIPIWLNDVIKKALSKNTQDRFKTANEMRQSLRGYPEKSPQKEQVSVPSEQPEKNKTIPVGREKRPVSQPVQNKNNVWKIGVIAFSLLLLSGIIGVFYYNQPGETARKNTNNNSQTEIAQNSNRTTESENTNLSNEDQTNENTLLENSSTNTNDSTNSPTQNRNGVPKFTDFPVTEIYSGKNALPIIDNENKLFKTRLKEASQEQKVNFAGHYIITTWGCGTTCVHGGVVDAISGKAYLFPFSISGWDYVNDEFKAVDENFKPVEARINSRLIVFSGYRNEDGVNGAHFYEFENGKFIFLYTNPRK